MTVCGDGGQWGASSNLLGYAGGPWSAVTAGDVVEFAVEITAHHRGHFEFGLCDKHVGPSTTDAQSCFDSRKLKRAPPAADCAPDDARGDCQPLDEEHPERWYLPPGVGTHKMRFQIPSDFECVSCTLQWRWWTANSCAPAEDYGCYFEKMNALGWTAREWCGTYCGTCGAPTEGTPGCGGEEFRNCADIEVRGAGNASGASTTQMPPSPTPTPTTGLAGTTLRPATEGACVRNGDCAANPWCQDESYHKWCADQGAAGACPEPRCMRGGGAVPTPAPSTTSMAATSEAPPAPAPAAASTGAPSTTASAPAPGTTAAPTPQACVSRAALQCINDYSSYWPRCSPEQAKSTVGPAGYEFGDYCDLEWAAALNEVLSDPAVDICGDEEAIRKFLAQVAYETGYYTTVYQTADGGAGLIHMIPGTWATNAQDMDAMWPGNGYAEKAASMGKNCFQTAAYGWRSVAAWFKRTNRVIGGCGVDLFGQPYERQTQCILSRVVDRSEAYGVVGRCLAQVLADAAGTSTAPPISEAASSTQPEAEPEPELEAEPEAEPATTAASTAAASTAAASTTAAPTTSASSVPSAATCVRNTDCDTSPWCAQAGYAAWCAAEGAQGSCPFPQCVLAQTQAPSLLSQDGGARAARRKRQRFLGTALIQRSGRLQQGRARRGGVVRRSASV